jgi:hypothetical protein
MLIVIVAITPIPSDIDALFAHIFAVSHARIIRHAPPIDFAVSKRADTEVRLTSERVLHGRVAGDGIGPRYLASPDGHTDRSEKYEFSHRGSSLFLFDIGTTLPITVSLTG